MSNNFRVCGSEEGIVVFIKSAIQSSEEILSHYDFVIQDISSEISDPTLEATKAPAIDFLKKMKKMWENFRGDLQRELKVYEDNCK